MQQWDDVAGNVVFTQRAQSALVSSGSLSVCWLCAQRGLAEDGKLMKLCPIPLPLLQPGNEDQPVTDSHYSDAADYQHIAQQMDKMPEQRTREHNDNTGQ